MTDSTASQLEQAVANARVLAEELAKRHQGGRWQHDLVVRTAFEGTTSPVTTEEALAPDGRVAVVCWDLGHNPTGRAMVLADVHARHGAVDLVGPLWSSFGTSVWEPLQSGGYSTVTFTCTEMTDFVAKAYAVASHRAYDLVHICKPRLPGLILGSMIARSNGCPVIVDIDDDEQAFFADAPELEAGIDALSADHVEQLRAPTEALGTAIGVSLATGAATRTVSNVALQERFGAMIVRHARSETVFDPAVQSRSAGRDRLGAADTDFVVLFVGTPRPHKGLDVVVEALRRLDDRFVLHVVGVTNPEGFTAELDALDVRVVAHRRSDMADLPEYLAAADAIALMQDPHDPISASQIPAKITDGLSMGVPVIVTDTPPLRDLTHHGLLRANDAQELAAQLTRLATGEDPGERMTRRQAFLSEFSTAVNAARVRASAALASTTQDQDAEVVATTVDLAHRVYVAHRSVDRADLFAAPDPDPADGVDIVFFWKQNDTGVYGRRSDMVAKYFAADPRVRRVLHFDRALATERAARNAQLPTTSRADDTPMLSMALYDRRTAIIQSAKVHHRTFLHHPVDGRLDPVSGEPLPTLDGYSDFVAAEMAALNMSPQRSLAWVCPVVPEFSDIHNTLKFGVVVSDVIDDQRTTGHPREVVAELDAQYQATLGVSNAVFTNCEPNVTAFGDYTSAITVVPNGAETAAFTPERRPVDPADQRAVVAYVGDLSDRLNWKLLDEVAELRPDVRFVIAGSAHAGGEVFSFAQRHANVELVGVVPYPQLPAFLQGVDVGIIPHLEGPMTDRMNPLKLYNFYSAGLPTVATPIANMGDFADHVHIERTASGFARAIDRGVEQRRAGALQRDADLLRSIDWAQRAGTILDRLETQGLLQQGR